MTTEVEQAVRKALEERDVQDMVIELTAAKEVTTGTILWSIFWSVLSPIVGIIIGVVNLVQGKTNKGLTYIGIAAVGWLIAFLILTS